MHFDRQRHSSPPTRVCFLMEPFAGGNADRERENNLICDEVIEPSVSAHDFRLFRGSLLCRPGHVSRDHQRLAEEADLVIANLSYDDPVVFYCLAWRLSQKPDSPVLVLLREDHDRLIEAPVLSTPPVVYDLSAGTGGDDGADLSQEKRGELMRRKLQEARRDLTKLVKQIVDREAEQKAQPHETAWTPPPQPPHPAPQPVNVDSLSTRQAVEDVMRQVISRMDNAYCGDIVDRLAATLMKPPRY